MISDFIDEGYEASLTQLSRKHEVILIRLFSPKEVMTKGSGFIPVMDAESGKLRWVNAANRAFRGARRCGEDGAEAALTQSCPQRAPYFARQSISSSIQSAAFLRTAANSAGATPAKPSRYSS